MTRKDNVIYYHIWEWEENTITLPRLDAEILHVSSLTAEEFSYAIRDGQLSFSVGEKDRLAPDTIIKIELDRPASDLL